MYPKRTIHLVMELTCIIENTIPFTGLPRHVTIEIFHVIVLWLNNFPVKSGMSTKCSLRVLTCHYQLNAKTHCKTPFGAYCGVHDELTPSNNKTPMTHEPFHMGLTSNIQGSYKFYCLKPRHKLTRRQWDKMLIPLSVIRKVNRYAK